MRFPIIVALAAAAPPSAAPADLVSQASGMALQADARQALKIIGGIDPGRLTPKDGQFVRCMRQRFGGPTASKPAASAFADRALAIYRSYWHAALTRPETRARQEVKLDAELRKLLQVGKSDDLDSALEKRIKSGGGHSLEGRTGLLRELMIWDKQDEKLVAVELPEGEYRVRVELLDGFKSFGWSHYATCGRRATGGWTTDDALFAVVPRYDSLDGEEFRVTFLGHEAQHFADKARFKNLEPWELEFRAKLTELALANRTLPNVLGKFIEDQGDDPASPHSFADRKVLKDLMARLRLQVPEELLRIDLSRVHTAAKNILLEDSARRAAAGQLKTTVK
jgi:hypothetical protein